MEKQSLRPYVTVIVLMAMTSAVLAFSVNVELTNEAGIRLEIPDEVGAWSGSQIFFCQAVGCQKVAMARDLNGENTCPECGGPMHVMSRIEAELLPADTGMVKKQFVDRSGNTVNASIVLSGKERGSIHRPELCLTGQGQKITKAFVVEVPIDGRQPLKVKVLELTQTWKDAGGVERSAGRYYAYWFVGKGRETANHYTRMYFMAADRVLHNVAHRWAYVSVGGIREAESDAYLDEIKDFVGDFYPLILQDGSS